MLAEVPDLPRLPELYLEAGMTLLMARRPVDCMTLCDEVITATLELLPDTVVLEEAEEQPDAGTGDAEGDHGALMLQWTCAAYLLQGHCHSHLNDWKQAVIHYTRSPAWTDFISVCRLQQNKSLCSASQVYQPAGEGVL